MKSANLHFKVDTFLPLLAGSLAFAAGEVGFRLVPDSFTYARHGIYLRPYPLSWIPGYLGGMQGVIIANALAVIALLYVIPRGRGRKLMTFGGMFFFLFPGMDALGAFLIALVVRYRRRFPYVLALLIHPVAALTTAPVLYRRTPKGFLAAAVLVLGIIVGFAIDGYIRHEHVNVFAHMVYTVRYALPLLACGTLLSEGYGHA
jgi:hypothetical protein